MYWHDGHGMGGWGYLLMAVSMLLFWGVVITGIVLLVRYFGRPQGRSRGDMSDPERILAERFARGEIGEEEYRRHSHLLRGGSGTSESQRNPGQ